MAVFALWLAVLILSLATGNMISAMGIVGTFGFFAAVTGLGGIYFIFALKSTEGLTSQQCKQLYWP